MGMAASAERDRKEDRGGNGEKQDPRLAREAGEAGTHAYTHAWHLPIHMSDTCLYTFVHTRLHNAMD